MLRLTHTPENAPAAVIDTGVVLAAMGVFGRERQTDSLMAVMQVAGSMKPVMTVFTRRQLVEKCTQPHLRALASFNTLTFVGDLCRKQTLVPYGPVFRGCQSNDARLAAEAALAGKASWLITDNSELLFMRCIGAAQVVTPTRFLQEIGVMPAPRRDAALKQPALLRRPQAAQVP